MPDADNHSAASAAHLPANAVTEIVAESHCQIDYNRTQQGSPEAFNITTLSARLDRDSAGQPVVAVSVRDTGYRMDMLERFAGEARNDIHTDKGMRYLFFNFDKRIFDIFGRIFSFHAGEHRRRCTLNTHMKMRAHTRVLK